MNIYIYVYLSQKLFEELLFRTYFHNLNFTSYIKLKHNLSKPDPMHIINKDAKQKIIKGDPFATHAERTPGSTSGLYSLFGYWFSYGTIFAVISVFIFSP